MARCANAAALSLLLPLLPKTSPQEVSQEVAIVEMQEEEARRSRESARQRSSATQPIGARTPLLPGCAKRRCSSSRMRLQGCSLTEGATGRRCIPGEGAWAHLGPPQQRSSHRSSMTDCTSSCRGTFVSTNNKSAPMIPQLTCQTSLSGSSSNGGNGNTTNGGG